MNVNFFPKHCQTFSRKKTFGLCDDPPPAEKPAYIDEKNGKNWIGVIENFHEENVTFTAIDHCVEFPARPDGKPSKRCDGVLTYSDTVAFVELKKRDEHGAKWVSDAEKQLIVSIDFFKDTYDAEAFPIKKAYIVNSERPLFRSSQVVRMEKFLATTDHVLRIEARIKID